MSAPVLGPRNTQLCVYTRPLLFDKLRSNRVRWPPRERGILLPGPTLQSIAKISFLAVRRFSELGMQPDRRLAAPKEQIVIPALPMGHLIVTARLLHEKISGLLRWNLATA
jgi:hypothetical protein